MKKIYIIPQTEVLQINVQSPLLQTSDPDGVMDPTETIDASEVDVKDYGNSFDIWGDDWDD